jgi:hypothetical protein
MHKHLLGILFLMLLNWFALLIILVIVTGITYLFVKGYLSGFLGPNLPLRYIVLFIIGVLVSGTILYLYSYFEIDAELFDRIGVFAGFIFVAWLEIKKKNSKPHVEERRMDKLATGLFISFWILMIVPLVFAVLFN